RSLVLDNPAQRRAPIGGARHAPQPRSQPEPVVLLASGAAALRKQWREGIHGFGTAEVSEYAQLGRTMSDRKPAVLLLDLQLPRLGGIGSVAALRRSEPRTKIVVLTSRPDEDEGVAALKMGAHGYCDRDIAPPLLGKALEALQNGEIWVGRNLTSRLLDELSALVRAEAAGQLAVGADRRPGRLPPRGTNIAALLGAGA